MSAPRHRDGRLLRRASTPARRTPCGGCGRTSSSWSRTAPTPTSTAATSSPGPGTWCSSERDDVLGYARVLDEGDRWRIGRVVLAPAGRGRGLADLLMTAALQAAPAGTSCSTPSHPSPTGTPASASTVDGDEFLEDGIPHVPMRRRAPARFPADVAGQTDLVVPADAVDLVTPSTRRPRRHRAARGGPWSPSRPAAALNASSASKAWSWRVQRQLARHVVRRGCRPRTTAARQRASRCSWWASSSSTRACDERRPGRGQAAAAGRAGRGPWSARPGSRRAAAVGGTGSKPIDGVIVGSTWSPANSSPAAVVGEHEVARGVARGVDRVERPRAQRRSAWSSSSQVSGYAHSSGRARRSVAETSPTARRCRARRRRRRNADERVARSKPPGC